MAKVNEIESFLRDHAIRPSYQRVQIYKYLKENPIHPTVEQIYHDLQPQIPTFSKTTVYNTMKLFTDKGLASTITIEEGETRYDANTQTHGHFKCRSCGSVFDFFFEKEDAIAPPVPEGFSLEEIHYYGWGLCPQCKGI